MKCQVVLILLLCALSAAVAGWLLRDRRGSQPSDASGIIQACQREQFDPKVWCRSNRSFHDHTNQASRQAIVGRLLHHDQREDETMLREIECISPSASSLLVHVLAAQERTGVSHSEAIRYYLRSPVADVRRHAVEAVGLEGLQSYNAEIRSALVAMDPGVRAEAVETAIGLQLPDIILQLENAAKDRDAQVRKAALQGMIQLDRIRAMELLEEVNRNDPDQGIRNWAHEALKFLGSHPEDKSTEDEREAIKKRSSGAQRK